MRKAHLLWLIWPLLFGAMAAGLLIGPVVTPWDAIFAGDPQVLDVIGSLRGPRVVTAACAGAVLGVAGLVMQAIFRNPLVEPGIAGVSAGAALGGAVAVMLGASLWLLLAGAFVGALVISLAMLVVGMRLGGGMVLLLLGIAWNAIAVALIGLMQSTVAAPALKSFALWSLGGMTAVSWQTTLPMFAMTVISLAGLLGMGALLNALSLGRREAAHLGVDPTKAEWRGLVFVALGVGAVGALLGFLAFVGLVVPHLLRLMAGVDHRVLMIHAAGLGALLLVVAELAARTVIAPAELPLGVVISLVGGPVFFLLLWRDRQRETS